MGLSLHAQWTLVASGLIAHSDAVMAGEECERLMALIDEQAEGDEYGEWLGIVSDPAQLESLLHELAPLPAEHHRDVLEEAWVMAIADGSCLPEEDEMLHRIAQKLGVEPVQLEFWKEAWSTAQDDTATTAAHALRWVLAPTGILAAADRKIVEARLSTLPTTDTHRDALVRALSDPCTPEDIGRELTALQRSRRNTVLRLVADAVVEASRSEDAAPRLLTLASGCGVSARRVDRWLEAG